MRTPIVDFVRAYREKDAARFHMPGHKGKGSLGIEWADITEIEGADVLDAPSGIIEESEANATALFGSYRTVYSAEGSSLSIRAMLYLALLWGKARGRAPLILAARNAHRVFLGAAALLDLEVEWLYGEGGLLTCTVTPEALEQKLATMPQKPSAVYLTSPDYIGRMADVRGLARVCLEQGVLLLVDNAHGAYLKFLPESRHPVDLGATMCCDSAHKTLSALTGAGYLHLSKSALQSDFLGAQVKRAMSLFASTSPSYLILGSLDALNGTLSEDGYRQSLADCAAAVTGMRARLTQQGFDTVGDEPLKLTLAPKSYGYTGEELGAMLSQGGVEPEFCDPDYLVLMVTPALSSEELSKAEALLSGLPRRAPILTAPPVITQGERVMSSRQALLSPGRLVPVGEAVGEILADAAFSCPPAVPVAVCGERITHQTVAAFAYYGITHCRVI